MVHWREGQCRPTCLWLPSEKHFLQGPSMLIDKRQVNVSTPQLRNGTESALPIARSRKKHHDLLNTLQGRAYWGLGRVAPKYLDLSFQPSGLNEVSQSEMRPETAKIFLPVSSTLSELGELDGSCVPKSYSLASASEKPKWGDSVSWQFLSHLTDNSPGPQQKQRDGKPPLHYDSAY